MTLDSDYFDGCSLKSEDLIEEAFNYSYKDLGNEYLMMRKDETFFSKLPQEELKSRLEVLNEIEIGLDVYFEIYKGFLKRISYNENYNNAKKFISRIKNEIKRYLFIQPKGGLN